jgi:dUTPase
MHRLDPDECYKSYWLNEGISDGIDLVAASERISKKHAAINLIDAGFHYYLKEKIKQHIDSETE